jgi:ribose transport system ATP-binding protein
VHQEASLFLNLTVWENIFLAREKCGPLGILDKKTMVRKVKLTAESLGYELDPHMLLGDMSLAGRQLAEITRALIGNPRFLIMDEPTAALTEPEVQKLFGILRRLSSQGVSVIYISHRLDEIVELADRATVLKDGRFAGTLEKGKLNKDLMITMMVGRSLEKIYPEKTKAPGRVLMEVRDLSSDRFNAVNLRIRGGEILGIGGLEGQGQRDFVRSLYGDVACTGGTVTIEGRPVTNSSIKKHIRAKMCYVTFDRRAEGIIRGHSVKHNMSIVALPAKRGFISGQTEDKQVAEKIREFRIKVHGTAQKVETLSGGNQQKVILARCILSQPKILIVDEPTKGIDVGSRMAIYRLLRGLADSGIAIIMLTSDMMELIGLSDRIVVFYEGRLTDEFPAAEATEERIMAAFSGEQAASC